MSRSMRQFGLVAVVAAMVAMIGCRSSSDPVAVRRAAVTADNATVLGFEATGMWSLSSGGTIVGLNAAHTQGSHSLEVAARGYAPLVSVQLSSLGVVSPSLSLDIMLPTQQANPSWFGAVQAYVTSPSLSLFNVYLGQVELTGLPLGTWQTISFQVANDVVAKLLGTYSDLTFTIAVNVPTNAPGNVLLDNIRFQPLSAAGCAAAGVPNGAFCDDTNACTQTDRCQSGVCAGSNTFAYGVPRPDPTATACPDGTQPVGCRAFDCDRGTDAGRWIALPACSGAYPACTQQCPAAGCLLSTQAVSRSGDLVQCSCSCVDPAGGTPFTVAATGCALASDSNACNTLCKATSNRCGTAQGCAIGTCTSGTKTATLSPQTCNASETFQLPTSNIADWTSTVNSSTSQVVLTVGASQTRIPISGSVRFSASATTFDLAAVQLSGSSFSLFGRSITSPTATLVNRITAPIKVVGDPEFGTPTIAIPANATIFSLSGLVGGTRASTEVVNTNPVNGTFSSSAGTLSLTGRFTTAAGAIADMTINAFVTNRPPQARITGDQAVECTGHRTGTASISGSTSSDPDGPISRVQWFVTNPQVHPEGGLVAVASAPSSQVILPFGTNNVVLNVYDGALGTSRATSTVLVRDTVAPTVQSPGNFTVSTGGASSTTVNLGFPRTTDACDPNPKVQAVWLSSNGSTINTTIADPAHATFPLGTQVVRWFGTDVGGNSASADQIIIIQSGLSGAGGSPAPAPAPCPQPAPVSTAPVAVNVYPCVFGRMNLTTNTREGTAAWASCSDDNCVRNNIQSLLTDANSIWGDTVSFQLPAGSGFQVIADPCPPENPSASCAQSCPRTIITPKYGDLCDADSLGDNPGYEGSQAIAWCQEKWGWPPHGLSDPLDSCSRGVVMILGNRLQAGSFCALGTNASPGEGDLPSSGSGPPFACDDPTKANNNNQGAWAIFPTTESQCFPHTLAHELGHALALHHGNGLDDDCNGLFDEKCDPNEYLTFDSTSTTLSLMSENGSSTVLTNLQKNRARAFASKTPPNTVQAGQNCGQAPVPPDPQDVGKPKIKTSGGCGCVVASAGSGPSSGAVLAIIMAVTLLRRRRRRPLGAGG